MSDKSLIKFLEKAFGKADIATDGLNIAVKCPSCGRRGKKKLAIQVKTGQWHCWSCAIKGAKLSSLIKKYKSSFFEEFKKLFKDHQHAGDLSSVSVEKQHEEIHLPEGFLLLAAHLNSRDPDIRDTIAYCRRRGLTDRDMWYFKLGTCQSGQYRRRVIMPSFDSAGKLNYYAARTIDQTKYMKYLNAKVAKKSLIFNELNIDWSSEVTLVEGPFDLSKCNSNAVCILGSHLDETYTVFQEIVRNNTPVLLALDPDAADKAQKYAKLFSQYAINVRMLRHGKYSDVGEMPKSEFENCRLNAHTWNDTQRLHHLIRGIKSGTLV